MTPVTPSFLGLDDAHRAHWIAAFFAAPSAPKELFGVQFPILRAGESPFTWLRHRFRQASGSPAQQERIRHSVQQLIKSELKDQPIKNRHQVLGLLLEVAGACGCREIIPTLDGWVRHDDFRTAVYRLGNATIPIRRKTWSLLIGWHEAKDLINPLKRDFNEPPSPDCVALCFAELGRLDPAEAIVRIPDFFRFKYPEPYWREALRQFLTNNGVIQVLQPKYRESWEQCFEKIVSDPGATRWFEESVVKLLEEEQIQYEREYGAVHLTSMERPEIRLTIRLPILVDHGLIPIVETIAIVEELNIALIRHRNPPPLVLRT
jgi:hypothetical protein